MKKPSIIHPIFFAISPILSIYSYQDNVAFTELKQLFPLLMISLAFAVLIWTALSLIIKDKIKAGLLVSLFLFLFFSYGHFYHSIRPNIPFLKGWNHHGFYLLLWLVLFILCAYCILKKWKNLVLISNFIDVSIIAMTMIPLSLAVKNNIALEWHYKIEEPPFPVNRDQTQFPDIYYLIFDAYANTNVLKERFDFDNSDIIHYLKEKGFTVIDDGKSNYPSTHQSIRSSLNMEFIQDSKHSISHNLVMYHLKQLGYKTVSLKSNYQDTIPIRMADVNEFCAGYSDFEITVIDTTLLTGLKQWIKWFDYIPSFVNRLMCVLDEIPRVHQKYKEPVFIFAHVLSPHPPFVLGQDGPLSDQERSAREQSGENFHTTLVSWDPLFKEYYFDQIVYLNKRIKEIIDSILSTSDIPPVIILQSDHGMSFDEMDEKTNTYVSLSEADPEKQKLMIKGRSYILNAYYLPAKGREMLYPTITPVNSFRVIFNALFDAGYDLLEDNIYWYELEDITDMDLSLDEAIPPL